MPISNCGISRTNRLSCLSKGCKLPEEASHASGEIGRRLELCRMDIHVRRFFPENVVEAKVRFDSTNKAIVAKLADAHASGACGVTPVLVQLQSVALKKRIAVGWCPPD